jgi:ATPase subunit of ABC transporter with duplicated ATPase domains
MDLTHQEVATCCRMGVVLGSDSRLGPGLAQVNMDTMFVRDADFLMELAQEMAGKLGDVYSQYWELKRANDAANEENAEKRKARTEALEVAVNVVHAMRSLKRDYPKRWQYWEKMVKKQTLRQIVRRSKEASGTEIAADIAWCSDYIRRRVGDRALEKLLTLRAILA